MDEVRGLKREVRRLAYELQASLDAVPMLRAMVEGSLDGLALIAEDGGLLEHNRAFAAMVDGARPPTQTDEAARVLARGTAFPSLFQVMPGDAPLWPPPAPGDGPRIVSPTGEEDPARARLEVLLTPVPLEAERRVWVASVRALTDATLQARALADARDRVDALTRDLDAVRRFETLFAHSPDALLLLDPSGRVLQRNARAAAWWPALGVGEDASAELPELLGLLPARASGPSDTGPALAFSRALESATEDVQIDAMAVPISLGDSGGVLVTARDTTAHRRAELALEAALARSNAALAEREVLLREVHHRVKNNLQIITSLLAMQADDAPEAVSRALSDSTFRVRSMALVHELLYGGADLAQLDFSSYLEVLAHELAGAMAPDATLTLRATPVALSIDQAIPAGLLVNELLTNAFKHGRSPDGRVRVTVSSTEPAPGLLTLSVEDEGKGLPEGRAEPRPGSLGMTIAHALAGQLGAQLKVASGPGARLSLTFALRPPARTFGSGRLHGS